MLSEKSIIEYKKRFPKDLCFFMEPDNHIAVSKSKNSPVYISSLQETDETFLDRLNRSIEKGKNLFYEEWEVYNSSNDVLC